MTGMSTHQRAGIWEVASLLYQTRRNWKHHAYLIHSVTSRCNARCGFCAWNPDFYDGGDELSTEEVKQLYSDARAAGFFALSMWGGEPLIRRDIGELAAHAHALGFMTNVVTNGAVLEKKMDEVVPWVDRICISVDHPSEKHDRIRGVKGLFGRILSATLKIRSHYPKKKIVFNCTLQKGNVDRESLEEMARLTKSLGVVGVYNAMRLDAVAEDPAAVDLESYNPSPEELVEAFEHVRRLKKMGYPVVNSYTHLDKMTHPPLRYRCHWPKFMLPIEANGDVVDCMYWGTRPIDNVRNTPFTEILRNPRLRDLAGPAGEKCHRCVSLHRIDISEIWDGRLEPLGAWARSVF